MPKATLTQGTMNGTVTAKQRNDAILVRLPHQHGGTDKHHCEDGVIDRGDSIAALWSIFAPPRTFEMGGDKTTIAGPQKLCRDWYCRAPRMTEKIETRFHAARQLVFDAYCALAEFEPWAGIEEVLPTGE